MIMRETNWTSPPSVTISDSEPVQAVKGGLCLVAEDVSISALDS